MSAIFIAFLWLVHFLPLSIVAAIGNALGAVGFLLMGSRRKVVRINLEKCFPDLDEQDRDRLARAHFRAFFRSVLERGILWWAPRARLERLIRVEGVENLARLAGKPAIILSPHFVGFEAAIMRLTMEFPVSGMYATQSDALADRVALRGRSRFGGKLMERQTGIWGALQVLRSGGFYFYLPDMDYGRKHSIFVPFFGVQTATVPALSQMAKRSGAAIVPCTTRILPGGAGYLVRLEPAWSAFPGPDPVADTRRMLAYIEERTREMPEQYYWLHKRFKTRPEGEASFY
jgi:KDO2-lipid IV(A) lauroyltransferase